MRYRLERKLPALPDHARLVLVTGHRRESFGQGIANLCDALSEIAALPDVEIVFPVHLNPHVKGPVTALLSSRRNIHLIPPQDYLTFVYLMKRASLIITDSGGIQEEAPSLGVPVLVTRTVTERPGALMSGRVELVGPDRKAILHRASVWLDGHVVPMNRSNPYGDGLASIRIVDAIMARLERHTIVTAAQ